MSEQGRDYCPTCGANGPTEECATRTGRDHPARRVWRPAFDTGFRAALPTPRPEPQPEPMPSEQEDK